MTEATEFRLLGPVEAERAGRPLPLGGRRQRELLALLLLRPGQLVSADTLIDELWRGVPPPGAEGTLRVYVSRLRSALADESLPARAAGYALEVDADRVDVARFEGLLREGRDALARGAAGLAADRLGAALALWRGPALSGVNAEGALALEAQRLDELRLACREEGIEAELALGRHRELVPELERLVEQHPLRERLWRQLVVALYRGERQSEALAAYRRARELLSAQLGLDPSEELRALERAVLRQEVPAVPPGESRHNLPAPLTSFVGRERELEELERLLREQRLITLTGMGGAGKTRLALETAQRQVGLWPGGVWLVDLMPVSDPALVGAAVARTLGVAERPDVAPVAGLLDHLREQELLLVLDNCEHLAEACAGLTHELLRACPDVRVLATSRISLGILGELAYALEPLPVPQHDAPVEEVAELASVRLFLERGRAARRDLELAGESLKTVGRICRELDGLPLAIELAAARAKALTLDEIAARLDDRFRLLRSWRRVADPRQQTLRATIDWSYDLLSEGERELLAMLSVFAGGFTLEAVSAICLDGDDAEALELVARLVESSLVVVEEHAGSSRYRLLETIREYAAERLGHADEAAARVRRAHAEYFLELVEAARPDFVRFSWEQQRAGLERLDRERDNLHAAVEWTLQSGSELALPLAASLRLYWNLRGFRRQGVGWLERALASPHAAEPPLLAEGFAGAALLARLCGDLPRARRHAEQAIAHGRAGGAPVALATALNVLVTLAGEEGDFDRARALSDESTAVGREAGSARLEAIAHFIFAEATLHGRLYADARRAGERALELARPLDDPEVLSIVLGTLGLAAALEGRLREAADQLLEALAHAREIGFAHPAVVSCDGLALIEATSGDAARAARLLGAAEAMRRVSGGVVRPAETAARDQALAAIRRTLADGELEEELDRGRRLTLDESVAEARRVTAGPAGV